MKENEARVGMRIMTRRLGKKGTMGMLIHKKHLSVRKRDVVGTLLQQVPGHGGDVWFVKHNDGTNQVGAYCFTEMEALPIWHDEIQKVGVVASLQDRLRFHNSLLVGEVSKYTGLSERTIKKHFEHLVDRDLATWSKKCADLSDWVISLVR